MRTNIVLDNKLVEEAMKLSGLKTKKEVIHQALLEFVQNHNRRDLRELQGKVLFDDAYDYKVLREDKLK